jgi:hypothetical protein
LLLLVLCGGRGIAPGGRSTLLRGIGGAYKVTVIGASAIGAILYLVGIAARGGHRRAQGDRVGSDRDANDATTVGAVARAIAFLAALTGGRGADQSWCRCWRR